MLSPDGKWVWDGTQWQPIAQHESVFPSWQSAVAVEPATPVAPVPAPVPMPMPTPALVQPVNPALYYPQSAPAAPLWKQKEPKQTGMNYALYFAAGIVGIVIILIVLNSVFPLWLLLPGPKASAARPSPQASPLPALTQRSDYARADYFANVLLAPQLRTLNPALTMVAQQCTRNLTNSCQDALNAVDPQIKSTLALINKTSLPLCVAPPVAKLKADINNMESALQVATSAYDQNQGSALAFAMGTFVKYRAVFSADIPAISSVAKAHCDTTETGP
jgi:hypothetical protein